MAGAAAVASIDPKRGMLAMVKGAGEATIARVLDQIDPAQSRIAGSVQDTGAREREAGTSLEQRVLDLLDELRRP